MSSLDHLHNGEVGENTKNAKTVILEVLTCIEDSCRCPDVLTWWTYIYEWSSYLPTAVFLQDNCSQRMNHQERAGTQHHKVLSCDPKLLRHCFYVRIDVGDSIHKEIYLEIQICKPILCFQLVPKYWLQSGISSEFVTFSCKAYNLVKS